MRGGHLAAIALLLSAGAFGAGATEPTPRALTAEDRIGIAEAVTGVGLYADLGDWARVEGFLAPRVTTDYVSLFGGAPAETDRAALVAQWRKVLPGFDATQHLIANVAVHGEGDSATARSHVRATHWMGDRFWTVGGTYTHRLARTDEGWRITFMGIQRLYEEGDRAVLGLAAERVAAGSR